MIVQIIVVAIILLSYGFDLYVSLLNYNNKDALLPEEVKDIYDEEKYIEWKNYSMDNFRFSLIVKSISTVLIISLLLLGAFPFFERISMNITDDISFQVVLFLAFYFLISFIINTILSYYRVFTIEEKYGFNKTTKKTFFMDKIKSLILTVIFAGSILYGLANLYYSTGDMFFIYAFIACALGMIVFQIIYIRLIVPMFNKLTPLEDGSLKTKIEDFAKSVGYEVGKISVMDASRRSTKLNAYFTGFGKLKKIVLYDTLIEKCSEEEVVAVLAHEIGHNKHKHIISGLLQTFIMLAAYLGLFLLLTNITIFSESFGFASVNLGFVIILFIILIEPIMIPINAYLQYISRKHEFQADKYAADNYAKEPMINALKVLSRENFSNLTPHPLYVKLHYSHPPTYQRIRAITHSK